MNAFLTFIVTISSTVPVNITGIKPNHPPYFNLTNPNTRYVNETDMADLECETEGTEPINVVWTFQNTCEPCNAIECRKHYPCKATCGDLSDGKGGIPERFVFQRNLTIPDISREYTGCYKCEAQNIKTRDEKYFKLVVQCKYIFNTFPSDQKINSGIQNKKSKK